MSVTAPEVYSGGTVRDADGRRVVIAEVPVGSYQTSGGQARDADGRRVVVIEAAS